MASKNGQGILGYFEILESGEKVHRLSSELFAGKYHPDWKHNLTALGYDLRNKLSRGEVTYRCDCCGGRLYLAGKHYDKDVERPAGAQRLHLRHFSNRDKDIECVYQEDEHKSKDEINKDSHMNKKESPQHFKLKAYLMDAFEREFPECSIEVEKWLRVDDTKRRPDINLTFNEDGLLPKGEQLVIEIQVRPILMADIQRRMDIDRAGKKYMMWILESFDPTQRKDDELYKEDIFSEGGLNAFVLDEEAMVKTFETGQLHLKVWYDKYHLQNGEVAPVEKASEIVPFSSLKFDKEIRKVYHYPSEAERDECFAKAKEIRLQREAEAERLRLEKVAEEARLAEIKRKQEEEQARLHAERLAREESDRISQEMYEKVSEICENISNATYWEIPVYEATEAFMHYPQDYIEWLFQSIKNMWHRIQTHNNNWNILIKTAKLLLDLSQSDDLVFEKSKYEFTICSLLRTALDQEKSACREPFQLTWFLDLFPNSATIIPGFLISPNYSISKREINWAKGHILANKGTLLQYQKYKDEQQRENQGPYRHQHNTPNPISLNDEEIGNLKINYAYWSAIILYARIVNSDRTDKDEMVETMTKNWDLVCVLLSLRQGFIVGWKFNHWVQFASYLKNKKPEFVPLFLSECIKHGYNLKSKKTDHLQVLTQFMEQTHPQLSENLFRLFSVIFP